MIVGILLPALMLAAFTGVVDPIKYGGINYGIGGTAFHRFLLKMTTPALTVEIQLRRALGETTFLPLILYPLMVVVQVVLYGIVGKVVSILFSDWVVLIFMITGIILLALTLAFEVNPIEGSVIDDAIKGTAFCLFLLITTLPALIAGLLLLGMLGETTFVSVIFFPFMFIVQILLYWIVGKTVGPLYSIVGKAFTHVSKVLT